MTEQSNYSQKACKNMCGFFGTESNDGYCSVCYKKHLNDLDNENDKASIRATNSSSRQTQSADCILSNPNANFKSEGTQMLLSNRMSQSNLKASLSEIACKIRAESISPSLKLPHDIPPMSALKSGTGMPGNQETFEFSANEEYSNDCDNLLTENHRCHVSQDSQYFPASEAIRNNKSDASSDQYKDISQVNNIAPGGEASKSKSNRCAMCKRKLGLTGFLCRCGGQFCSIHRYSDKHDCSFDYKEYGQRQIRKNNPVVSGEKISKI